MAVWLDGPEKEEIVRLYKSGKSMRQVASILGRSYQTVQRILTQYGVEKRPGGFQPGNYKGRKRKPDPGKRDG